MPAALYSKCIDLLNDELSRKAFEWLTIYILLILHKSLKQEFWVKQKQISGHLQNKLPCEDTVAAIY